jgi:hypothetical protein
VTIRKYESHFEESEMKTLNLLILAFGLFIVILTSGCTSPRGPVTPGNIWSNYACRIDSVHGDIANSLVIMRGIPWNAVYKVQGWFVLPSVTDHPSDGVRRTLGFTNDVIDGISNTNGVAYFVMESFDHLFPNWWWDENYSALSPNVPYDWMATIDDSEKTGRILTEVWQTLNGTDSIISRGNGGQFTNICLAKAYRCPLVKKDDGTTYLATTGTVDLTKVIGYREMVVDTLGNVVADRTIDAKSDAARTATNPEKEFNTWVKTSLSL